MIIFFFTSMSKYNRNRIVVKVVVSLSGHFLDLVKDLWTVTSRVNNHKRLGSNRAKDDAVCLKDSCRKRADG